MHAWNKFAKGEIWYVSTSYARVGRQWRKTQTILHIIAHSVQWNSHLLNKISRNNIYIYIYIYLPP